MKDERGVFLKVKCCYECPMRLLDQTRRRYLNLCVLTKKNIKHFKDSIPKFCELKPYDETSSEER